MPILRALFTEFSMCLKPLRQLYNKLRRCRYGFSQINYFLLFLRLTLLRLLRLLFARRRRRQGYEIIQEIPAPKIDFDLLKRRTEKFTLWIPGGGVQTPRLVLGILNVGKPVAFKQLFEGDLVAADEPDLFELDPDVIQPSLKNDTMYHYWFVIQDTSPENLGEIQITDPLAYTVDYSLTNNRDDHEQPASVIKFRAGKLWPCDIDGKEPGIVKVPLQEDLPDNNHMVIYELPASWSKWEQEGNVQVDIGTFADVLALFDPGTIGENFSSVSSVAKEAIIAELGINALELLPAADAKPLGEWGYATAHYLAPDFDLGTNKQLVQLVETIHSQKVRFITDVVMAFGRDPYVYAAFKQFHINPQDEPWNGDSWQSHRNGRQRQGFGSRPWRYIQSTSTYDPETGGKGSHVHPSWSFHHTHLTRWMNSFNVDGLRLDSINNIANYDFLKSYKSLAWDLYRSRYPPNQASDAKFLVAGEDLKAPLDLITSGTLNGLWNEPWQVRLRSLIIGEQGTMGDAFEYTVRKLVNCLLDREHPFKSGTQAINYITSHDVEGPRKERLFNYLQNCGIQLGNGTPGNDLEKRAMFAWALHLTSVGIPMIFAGEEFCDQMDRPIGRKQADPVNYERLRADRWRSRIFAYVSNLVKFRKSCPALGDDDTAFIHLDGNVMAWVRGGEGNIPVVVVANFQDRERERGDGTYVVNNWPEGTKEGWWEVTKRREVAAEWVGREPLMAWEVKVYTRWRYPS